LWPLFHYFVDGFRYSDAQYEAYQRMNQRYARMLQPLLEPDDLIWVHDYHLFPLAQRCAKRAATQPIGLFLHIPFPNIEVLRVLPVYGELLQAMVAYDVLGFQTETDRDAFRGAVAYVWGPQALTDDESVTVGGRRVLTGVYPIGVDVEAVQREATESLATDSVKRMIAGLLGRRLMIGVDRLDYSKGLVERFKAYERFLETHPENQNRVSFLQIAPLSRADVRAYAEIRRDLEQTTGRTNGRFADTDWTPIRYLNRNFPHDVLMGFMRSALIGIVTPVRDGMNLVAKEFVAAQDPSDPGVLILSTLAGAARELGSAVMVNPYDTRGMAHAIQHAFNMPLAERRERHQAMLEVLRRNSIEHWHTSFVNTLESLQAPRLHRRAS
jgi:trehalose 6-phosphate synthase